MLQLVSLKVENFRELKEGSIDFEKSTVIIGENGSGISTLLEAISLTLDHLQHEDSPSFNKYHFHVSNTDDERDRKLAINLRLQLPEKWIGSDIERIELFPRSDENPPTSPWQYDLRFESVLTDSGAKTKWTCTDVHKGARSNNPALLRRIRELIPVVRLKPVALMSHESALRNNNDPSKESRDRIDELKEQINIYASEIILGWTLNIDTSVENGFECVKSLIEELQQNNADSTPVLSETLKLRELLQMVSAPSPQVSSQIESFDSFSQKLGTLLLVNALIVNGPPNQDVHASPLLIFESPEAGLHTSTLATIGTLINKIDWQKIVTTNSGWLLGAVPFDNIRRVRRKENTIRCSRIHSSNYSTEDLRRIAYHLRIQNNTASYARYWILVEGETENWILPHLARIMGYNLVQEGIAVIDFAQTGLKPIIKFADDLDIGWHALIDGDAAGTRYKNTLESIVAEGQVNKKITELGEEDIENFFWNNGFVNVYADGAKLNKIPRDVLKPKPTIKRAMKKYSKPYMALKIIEEISAKGKESIPPLLYQMIESCIRQARSL